MFTALVSQQILPEAKGGIAFSNIFAFEFYFSCTGFCPMIYKLQTARPISGKRRWCNAVLDAIQLHNACGAPQL